jgi:hypothetical protein
MTDAEFRTWLESEVKEGRMTVTQQADILEQKDHFDRNRADNERRYRHQIVGYVNGEREVSATVQELISRTRERHPGRMVYFEPIAFDLF